MFVCLWYRHFIPIFVITFFPLLAILMFYSMNKFLLHWKKALNLLYSDNETETIFNSGHSRNEGAAQWKAFLPNSFLSQVTESARHCVLHISQYHSLLSSSSNITSPRPSVCQYLSWMCSASISVVCSATVCRNCWFVCVWQERQDCRLWGMTPFKPRPRQRLCP